MFVKDSLVPIWRNDDEVFPIISDMVYMYGYSLSENPYSMTTVTN